MDNLLALLSVIAVASANVHTEDKDFVYASLEDQKRQGWNPRDSSSIIHVMEDGLMFERTGGLSTDCIRGKVGFSEGRHAWEIFWPRSKRFRYCALGVATSDAPLLGEYNKHMFGINNQSWGWNVNERKLYPRPEHNSESTYPTGQIQDPETITVLLDMDEGTLSFVVKDRNLGEAFRGLKGRKLYPMVCSIGAYAQVTIKFMTLKNDLSETTVIKSTESIADSSAHGHSVGEVTRSSTTTSPQVISSVALYTAQNQVTMTPCQECSTKYLPIIISNIILFLFLSAIWWLVRKYNIIQILRSKLQRINQEEDNNTHTLILA